MLNVIINHFAEDGRIDFSYLYDNNIEKALKDIENIEDIDNYRVSIFDDDQCTIYESTFYTLDYFTRLYGG